ncbi:hypothetical protein EHS25_003971 [Saitozyma podzolica]|uniref:Uncharacterized protein n=1 Tax=Saitozyma podzolica TaxID=1890683 RepID=A0A427YSP3_9TREE|nr:hypothetical protein EHS25_003971 [Saitozyma podzolica]
MPPSLFNLELPRGCSTFPRCEGFGNHDPIPRVAGTKRKPSPDRLGDLGPTPSIRPRLSGDRRDPLEREGGSLSEADTTPCPAPTGIVAPPFTPGCTPPRPPSPLGPRCGRQALPNRHAAHAWDACVNQDRQSGHHRGELLENIAESAVVPALQASMDDSGHARIWGFILACARRDSFCSTTSEPRASYSVYIVKAATGFGASNASLQQGGGQSHGDWRFGS